MTNFSGRFRQRTFSLFAERQSQQNSSVTGSLGSSFVCSSREKRSPRSLLQLDACVCALRSRFRVFVFGSSDLGKIPIVVDREFLRKETEYFQRAQRKRLGIQNASCMASILGLNSESGPPSIPIVGGISMKRALSLAALTLFAVSFIA